jgi:hypothetical protein
VGGARSVSEKEPTGVTTFVLCLRCASLKQSLRVDRKPPIFFFQSAHESSKGVSGYRNTQDALENVSTMKSEYDQMKGKTLEDISQMVQRLTARITKKKEVLAPMIQELRPLRQQAQVLRQHVTYFDDVNVSELRLLKFLIRSFI